ncbi:MAG: hypothetical protein KJ970_06320 [Candidatus Eisenbacteria bacterium]|uniref:Outer membrane protein beta-barrel domain-containing protein n=1 Tax=Eiseniibacteriota bacterium TaxID=2212470 RepID=A0A948RV34_UNCEI|nr:hypothetical protein [Candidatus Eisenbacteria bacterium]MBU1947322.1 hypothetical protein [Candidatus Eisenbacteria bacterium]MBU2690526.1 hypothetical protein [Candidatus Eisenbacteria bacterium]
MMKNKGSRIGIFMLSALFVMVLCGSTAQATEIGIRYGRTNIQGKDLFKGMNDLGNTHLMGLQVIFDFLPILDVELAGETYEKDFSFSDGEFDDVITDGDGKISDLIILGTAKVGVPGVIPFLSHFYVGLGLSAHFLNVDINPINKSFVDKDAVEEAIKKVAGESTEVEWHGVLGLKVSLPTFPLSAFAEVRYQDVLDKNMPDMNSAYLGLNLKFN